MKISDVKKEIIINFYEDIHEINREEAEELFKKHYENEQVNRNEIIRKYCLFFNLEWWEAEDLFQYNMERGLINAGL